METKETKKCPYCGQEILAVAKKCKHCGKWLDGRDDPKTDSPQSTPVESTPKVTISENKAKGGGKMKWIAIAAVAVVVIAVVGFVMGQSPSYDYVGGYYEGLIEVEKNQKHGYVDIHGKVVIPLEYEDANKFSEGLAAVEKSGKWGFIDKTGKVVIPFEYDNVLSFENGTAAIEIRQKDKVGHSSKHGLVDKQNHVVFDETDKRDGWDRFEAAHDTKRWYEKKTAEGLTISYQQGKYGFVDDDGNEVIPHIYEDAVRFNEGLAAVKKYGKWGFIDKEGNEVIPFKYEPAGFICLFVFSEGLVAVRNGSNDITEKNCGYIDKQGKEVLPFNYWLVEPFHDGYANVSDGDNWFLIDKTGKRAF